MQHSFPLATWIVAGIATSLVAGAMTSSQALTVDEEAALRNLCLAGVHANGGVWKSERINAAIATLAFGRDWPDGAQATAYKTCNGPGYLNWLERCVSR